MAAWPVEYMIPAEYYLPFEEISEEIWGQPGGISESHKHLGSNPRASIDLSDMYCYKMTLAYLFSFFDIFRGKKVLNFHIILKHKGKSIIL